MSVTYHRYTEHDGERTKTEDWAEYEGCAELEMRDLLGILNGGANTFDLLQTVVKRVHLQRPATGEIITELTPENMLLLRAQVLDWLRSNVREAARDEAIDPEA